MGGVPEVGCLTQVSKRTSVRGSGMSAVRNGKPRLCWFLDRLPGKNRLRDERAHSRGRSSRTSEWDRGWRSSESPVTASSTFQHAGVVFVLSLWLLG